MNTEEIVEKIKIKEEERNRVMNLLKLKVLCRIRGLTLDIENQKEKSFYEGAKVEMEEIFRHLEDIKYIEADIYFALKYLSNKEKDTFNKIKTKYIKPKSK